MNQPHHASSNLLTTGLILRGVSRSLADGRAGIRAEDYWTLKRIGRMIRSGRASGAFTEGARENLTRIDLVQPSRQVHY